MRARTSLIAAVVAFAFATGTAYADGPAAVYNDYAQDGQLSCNHSRSALQSVLRSGSLNQYGDPYTLARLKLTIRRQLAGGCRAGSSRSRAAAGTAAGRKGGTGTGNRGTTGTQGSSRRGSGSPSRENGRSAGTSQRSAAPVAASSGGNAGFVSERAIVAGLLVAGLAVAGWLTRRGLAARP